MAAPLLVAAAARERLRPWLGPAVAAALVVAWLPATPPRIAAWRTEATLFAFEAVQEPDNPFAVKALGRILVEQGDPERGLDLWQWALEHPPASTFVMDVQEERLDFAQAAAARGRLPAALEALDAFIAAEAAAGRSVHPSVRALRERIAAQMERGG